MALRPSPDGPELAERIPGSRAAQAVERAFEALRLLGTVRGFDEDPPGCCAEEVFPSGICDASPNEPAPRC
ncbi:hypothetical protein [Brachybacterium sp. Z12]|uniref:hypothetical protein n=1 Tax=Brachybacterium sp. Z12 TaxID=2759167 RepID=UPI00223B2A94|nr:hypothetical protein [Brachybacterium sp. Z12]